MSRGKGVNRFKTILRKVVLSTLFLIMVPLFYLIFIKVGKLMISFGEIEIFTINSIIVNGNRVLKYDDVVGLVKIENEQIFDIETLDIERRVLQSPFVEVAKVERVYPSTIKVTIKEYNPFALKVDKDGVLQYINGKGEWMGKYRGDGVYNLPIIRGDMDSELAVEFLKEASLSELITYKISEVFLTEKGISFLLTDNSVNVIVGYDNFDRKIVAFQEFYKKYFDQLDYKNIKSIDLRFPNQIVVDNKKVAVESVL